MHIHTQNEVVKLYSIFIRLLAACIGGISSRDGCTLLPRGGKQVTIIDIVEQAGGSIY